MVLLGHVERKRAGIFHPACSLHSEPTCLLPDSLPASHWQQLVKRFTISGWIVFPDDRVLFLSPDIPRLTRIWWSQKSGTIIGIVLHNLSPFTWPDGPAHLGDTFGLLAQRAERAGFSSLWVMDHFFQLANIGPAEQEMLEGWSTLAYAAALTNRIKLGTLVTGVTYRHPSILVKTATTLDVLSHGRSYFGIGAAWNEQEHRGLGIPFPPVAERFERLEETLQIALQMWAGDETPYRGKYYQLERPLNSPQAVQMPHPPVLIGGGGERKTLRLVARYADVWNFSTVSAPDPELVQHKLAVLREHCQAISRPYEQIEKTTLDVIHLSRNGRQGTITPAAAIERLAFLASLGIDQVIFCMMDRYYDGETFDLLATEVIPAVETRSVNGLWPFEPTASMGAGPLERGDRAVGSSRDYATQCSARVGAGPTGTSGVSTLTRVVSGCEAQKREKTPRTGCDLLFCSLAALDRASVGKRKPADGAGLGRDKLG